MFWGKPDKAAQWQTKLATEQEAVASHQPGQSSADEKQDDWVGDQFHLDRVPIACGVSAPTAKRLSARI